MSPFEQWLEQNRPKLVEWYCEGTMVDKDFLTRIEEFAREAWQAGQQSIGLGVYRGTRDFEDYY